jgi:hypothetical protein
VEPGEAGWPITGRAMYGGHPDTVYPRAGAQKPTWRRKVSVPATWVARCEACPPIQGVLMSVAAIPFALAGTGYGLIGLLVIVLLVVLIVRMI